MNDIAIVIQDTLLFQTNNIYKKSSSVLKFVLNLFPPEMDGIVLVETEETGRVKDGT